MRETLEQALKRQIDEGKIDINGRIQLNAEGHVHVYWHPTGKDGMTVDLVIRDDGVHFQTNEMHDVEVQSGSEK